MFHWRYMNSILQFWYMYSIFEVKHLIELISGLDLFREMLHVHGNDVWCVTVFQINADIIGDGLVLPANIGNKHVMSYNMTRHTAAWLLKLFVNNLIFTPSNIYGQET